MSCPENDEVTGRVTGFIRSPEGEIAFVETKEYGSVSVLLNMTCWRDVGGPRKDEIVVMSGLTKFTKGWRAMSARKFTRADERLCN